MVQEVTKIISTNGTKVRCGPRHSDHPLRNTDGILCGATCNVLHRIIFDELGVQGCVFLFGKNGVVETHTVFLQQVRRDVGRDVEQWIAHALSTMDRMCKSKCFRHQKQEIHEQGC